MNRRWRKRTIGTALTAWFLLSGGCFFSPRESEDPNQIGPPVDEPAKTPEEVTTKLVEAFGSWNDTKFLALLSEDYVYRPDRSDSTDLADAGVFPFADPWDRNDEELVFNRILACFNDGTVKSGTMVLSYTGEQVLTDSSVTGFSTFETDYHLGIYYVFLVAGAELDSVAFDGALKLFIRDEGDGTYAAYRWEDFRKGSRDTWGFYKGQVESNQEYCPE
ncbi:MAG: hypothetical protein ABIK65_00070 [Candidatus Eisenbacteria bacterium]